MKALWKGVRYAFLGLLCATASVSGVAVADAYDLAPTADTSTFAHINFGTDTSLPVSQWDHAVIQFDLADLPAGVSEARLRIYAEQGSRGAYDLVLYPMANDGWSENSALPAEEALTSSPLATSSIVSNAYVEFDVSAFVAAQKASDGHASFELSTPLNHWNRIASRESATPPVLVVQAGLVEPAVLTQIQVTPTDPQLVVGDSLQFSAAAIDQYGDPIAAAVAWTVSGGGQIDSSGNFSAQSVGGPFTVTASSGGIEGSAQVSVIDVAPENVPPQASFSADPTSGTAPLTVTFTSTSTDSDGQIVSQTWDFGDGNNDSGTSVTHTYASAGDYTVTLSVEDNLGATDQATDSISVSEGNGGDPVSNLTLNPIMDRADADRYGSSPSFPISFWDHGFMMFDLGALSGPVTSATLRFYYIGTDPVTVSVTPLLNDSWAENGPAPAEEADLHNPLGETDNVAEQWVDIPVTDYINEQRADGFASFELSSTSNSWWHVAAREGAMSPELVVQTGPVEPPAPPVLTEITVSPSGQTVVVGDSLLFSASAVDQYGDPIAAAVDWTVSGDGQIDSSGHFSAQSVGGPFTVTASSGGIEGAAQVSVVDVAPENVPPQASFSADPTSGTAPLTVTFTSTSSDSDGQIVSQTWDFGDGDSDSGTSVTHTYASAGDYTVTLSVADNLGATDNATDSINVSEDSGGGDQPADGLRLNPIMDRANSDAYGSDPSFPISFWDHGFMMFDISALSGTVTSATLRFYYIDTTPVTVTVTPLLNDSWAENGTAPDEEAEQHEPLGEVGDVAGAWVEIPVTDYINEQRADGFASFELYSTSNSWRHVAAREGAMGPELVLETEPLAPPVLSEITVAPSGQVVVVGDSLPFSASAVDQYGDPIAVAIEWTVSGGGQIDSSGSFSAQSLGGPFTVTATSGEVSGSALVTVVAVAPENQLPQASFTADPDGGSAPLTVTFTSTSIDADGQIVSQDWNFGDGSSDSGPSVTHTYEVVGDYTVTLSVQDSLGATDAATGSISVSDPARMLTLNPIMDRANADRYGSDPSFPISLWDHGFMMFDVSALSGPVASAALRFYYIDTTPVTVTVSPLLNDSWAESGAAPAKEADLHAPLGEVGDVAGEWVEIAVTDYINEQLADGRASFELYSTSSSWKHVAAREGLMSPELVLQTEAPELTGLSVGPDVVRLAVGETQLFSVQGFDQFGRAMDSEPSWAVDGGGSIDANGLFTATQVGGPFTVTATENAVSASAEIWVTPADYSAPKLVISEIYYDPPEGQEYEFIEILNAEASPVQLDGMSMSAGVEFTFPAGAVLEAGERLLLVRSAALYAGGAAPVYQWESGFLDNAGETLRLVDVYGFVVDEVSYENSIHWGDAARGFGHSLEVIDSDADNSLPLNWQASSVARGTPGAAVSSSDPVLVRILISPDVHEVVMGETVPFEASGVDQHGVLSSLTPLWAVSGGGVIDENGRFDANSPGLFSVSATVGEIQASLDLSVVEALGEADFLGMTLTPFSAFVYEGESIQFSAIGHYSDDRSEGVAPEWSVSGGGAIDANGLFTAGNTAGGPYTVDAWLFGLSAQTEITVLSAASKPVDLAVPTSANPAAVEASRFLGQATFGSELDEVEALIDSDVDLEAWIAAQLALPPTYHAPLIVTPWQDGRLEAWWEATVQGNDQLRQKMAWALSQIMVISDRGCVLFSSQVGVVGYYDLLVEHALGNFRDLLGAVSRNPAMGFYLSLKDSQKENPQTGARPDENYAREIMQLFSIGLVELNQDGTPVLIDGEPVPTYTQQDVEELSRALTGWGAADGWGSGYDFSRPMVVYSDYHDTGEKRFLGHVIPAGQTVEEDMDDALDVIFNHPNVGPFIGRQLIQRFVTSNPSPEYISRVAAVFSDNGSGVRGDLAAVVRAVLMDSEARTLHEDSSGFGKLREPILKLTHLFRAFDSDPILYPFHKPEVPFLQAPLRAESVFNFYYPDYRPPGEFGDSGKVAPELQILNESSTTTAANQLYVSASGGHWNSIVDLDVSVPMSLVHTPEGLVDYLDLVLTQGLMDEDLKASLIAYFVAHENVSDEARVRDLIYQIITSPEYAVQR